jgi:hypothetical protein
VVPSDVRVNLSDSNVSELTQLGKRSKTNYKFVVNSELKRTKAEGNKTKSVGDRHTVK